MMDFLLPEDDQDYLASKGIKYTLLTEVAGGATRRGILFGSFAFRGDLWLLKEDDTLAVADSCDILVVVPDQYPTTKLDSFYTYPRLRRSDRTNPRNTDGDTPLFDKTWQFWSRHLDAWRPGVDGLATYLAYIRAELRTA